MRKIVIMILSFCFCSWQIQGQSIVRIDTSVNGIKLNNQKSFISKLGKKKNRNQFESGGLFPRIECFTKKNDQILRLYFFYGGSEYSVDQIEILTSQKGYKHHSKEIKVGDTAFVTSNGIKLGMKKNEVVKIIGLNYKAKVVNGAQVLIYKVESSSPFLKRYNQPGYFIRCTFNKGILVSYMFGFDYA